MAKMISDPDDASAGRKFKKNEPGMPEQLGSAIRVDGKRVVDNFPRQAAVIRQGLEDKVNAEKAREKERAEGGASFKENMDSGRTNAMGDTYKKGGAVRSSASRRADGIASKGKTRGTMIAMCGGGMAKRK